MKKTLRKITTILLVLMLTAGLVASAMADNIYSTEGFTIPVGRIGGERPAAELLEIEPAAPENELPDPLEVPEKTQEINEPDPEEALDENVEGLVVVEGEEKTEEANISEQTEVWINNADNNENAEDKMTGEEIGKIIQNELIQIRKDPDGLSEIIAEIPVGTELQVFDRNSDWFLILCEDIVGYVHITQMPDVESLTEEGEKTARKVNIFTSRKTMVTEGEPIHLTSIIQGFDDCTLIEYQWEYDRGNGWEEVPDATGPTYTYIANADTLKYSWRLRVHWETPD